MHWRRKYVHSERQARAELQNERYVKRGLFVDFAPIHCSWYVVRNCPNCPVVSSHFILIGMMKQAARLISITQSGGKEGRKFQTCNECSTTTKTRRTTSFQSLTPQSLKLWHPRVYALGTVRNSNRIVGHGYNFTVMVKPKAATVTLNDVHVFYGLP